MSCSSPVLAFQYINPVFGRCLHFVKVPYTLDSAKKWFEDPASLRRDLALRGQIFDDLDVRFFWIPCGKCLGCRSDQARSWSIRANCEFFSSDFVGSFITLTYNDDHLPFVDGVPSLDKSDYQNFLKRLRIYIERHPDLFECKSFRYFGCGEYGVKSSRPHYHFILFGLTFPDLVPWSRTSRGSLIYRSKILDDLWSVDGISIGFASVGSVTEDSIDYVARYTLKKLYQCVDCFPVKPFTCASRRPALGLSWFEKYGKSLFHFAADGSSLGASMVHKGFEVAPPRYFLKKFEDFSKDSLDFQKYKDYSMRMASLLDVADLFSGRRSVCDDLTINRFLSRVSDNTDYEMFLNP